MMNNIIKFKNINIGYIIILIYVIIHALLVNRFSIPLGHHIYLVKANFNISYDLLSNIHSFVRTPVYLIFDYLFKHPDLFFISSYFFEIIFTLSFFGIIYKISKNSLATVISCLLFFPLSQKIISIITGLDFSLISQFGYTDWGSFNLTSRAFFGFLFILSFYFYLQRNLKLFLIFFIINSFTHPNNFFLVSCIFILCEFIYSLFYKERLRYFVIFCVTFFLTLIPILINLSLFYETAELVDKNYSSINWFKVNLYDELDDFSSVYYIYYNIKSFVFIFILSLISILVSIFNHDRFSKLNQRKLFIINFFIIVPYLIFFLSILTELIFFNTNNQYLQSIIIQIQPYKILRLTLFPLIILWSLFISQYLVFVNHKISKILLRLIFIFFLVIFFITFAIDNFKFKNLNNKIEFFSAIKNFDQEYHYEDLMFLNQTYVTGNKEYSVDPSFSKIFMINNYEKLDKQNFKNTLDFIEHYSNLKLVEDKVYQKKYNQFHVLKNILRQVRKLIPKNKSVIVPPYLRNFRDYLPQHNLFLVEKMDGNLMMGSKNFSTIVNNRLELLTGKSYNKIFPLISGLQNTHIRELYLKLDENDFRHLKSLNKDFSYIVTEKGHNLNFKKLYFDEYYQIYLMD